jgi:hypothetical protein
MLVAQFMRSWLAAVFLLAQLASIIYAQAAGNERYFCWAPNDYMVSYQLEVRLKGRRLDREETRLRYRLPSYHVYQNIVTHMENLIRQYETTYGRNDHAAVVLKYSSNGGPQKEWRWPQ